MGTLHPGKPDLPQPKRSSNEVKAKKAEKAQVQSEKEHLCSQMIETTARLEAHMEAQFKEKLATAHHPPPNYAEEGAACSCQEVVSGGARRYELFFRQGHWLNIG